ncbi:hypothetical protein [Bacillus bingmayongensis]|uniref:hypothetical protein n=1 Tax=Bacillus bingmayongensis TaxID=1150157 RepID=UPI001C8D39C4|nr:hypothetical protein [Bacillus bingmayongensis]MBY0598753.1 hypothetical protein [Bacillus bingmayongensis]
MIKEIINQQNVECIGGFIAQYADAIIAHVNPGKLHQNNIVIIIKSDKTIWATKVIQQDKNQNNINWVEITRENIKKKTSPIMRKACYFEIKKGDLFGTYVISEDLILNEQFGDNKSYLDFMVG